MVVFLCVTISVIGYFSGVFVPDLWRCEAGVGIYAFCDAQGLFPPSMDIVLKSVYPNYFSINFHATGHTFKKKTKDYTYCLKISHSLELFDKCKIHAQNA